MVNNQQNTDSDEQEILRPGEEPVPAEKRSRLMRGVGIFLGMNAGLWLLSLLADSPEFTVCLGWAAMLINLAVLAYFARYGRDEAGGMLGAFAVLIILIFIIAPVFWLVQCFSGVTF